ncbi:hypothetical protein DAPPUDRAFT_112576 [Daphnia pulex]|uniref:Uncharacterized protein n=1 Tax=Daphnia pulex TaxID=6669 RepID=E9HCG0_DAPPU|nr:hypothetical protein DAPPUDRAFT_112576 [Daphnia pulex]|eukprot:EFX70613.1 hypothetical protein DAPPUDRAFT_112576 [Daphnia pulex]
MLPSTSRFQKLNNIHLTCTMFFKGPYKIWNFTVAILLTSNCADLCWNVNVHYTKMNPEACRFGKHAVQHIQIPEAESHLTCATFFKPSARFHPTVQTCAVNVNNMWTLH